LQHGDAPLAGVMDATKLLGPEDPSCWSVYWAVADADASAQRIIDLGGSLVHPPHTSPYGRLVAAADPTGATFKLREA
jgi:uncharacterized protein